MTQPTEAPSTDIKDIIAAAKVGDEIRICLKAGAVPGYVAEEDPERRGHFEKQRVKIVCLVRDGEVLAQWDLAAAGLFHSHGNGNSPKSLRPQVRMFLTMLGALLVPVDLRWHSVTVHSLTSRIWGTSPMTSFEDNPCSAAEVALDPRYRGDRPFWQTVESQLSRCAYISVQIASLSASWSTQSSL